MELDRRLTRRTAARRSHSGELGLTIPELLVSIVVLTIIAGSLGGAFAIGLRLLDSGGARAYLTGNGDLLSLEQQLGADLARASCISAGATTVPSVGCGASLRHTPSTCASGWVICLAWYPPGASGATCHTVSYSQQAGTSALLRTDNQSTGSPLRFTTGGLDVQSAMLTPYSTANGYTWTSKLTLLATQSGTSGAAPRPVNTAFNIVPLIADPASPVVSGGTAPC